MTTDTAPLHPKPPAQLLETALVTVNELDNDRELTEFTAASLLDTIAAARDQTQTTPTSFETLETELEAAYSEDGTVNAGTVRAHMEEAYDAVTAS